PFSYLNVINFSDYDKIIINDVGAAYYAGVFFDESLLRRSVLFLLGSEAEEIYESPSLNKRVALFGFFHRRAINKCSKVIAVSNFLKSKFILKTGFHYLSSKISILHTPVDRKKFYR